MRLIVISPADRIQRFFEKVIFYDKRLEPRGREDVLPLAPRGDLDFSDARSFNWENELKDALRRFEKDPTLYIAIDEEALPNATHMAEEILRGAPEARGRFIALSLFNGNET